MKHTPEYGSWCAMKKRCFDKNDNRYPGYGGRGISVCERWVNSFEAFYEDMGPSPIGYQIDRVNNDGNYEPQNCRWATRSQQCRNRRSTVFATIDGVTKPLVDFIDEFKMPYLAVYKRIKKGWPPELALKTPVKSGNRLSKLK